MGIVERFKDTPFLVRAMFIIIAVSIVMIIIYFLFFIWVSAGKLSEDTSDWGNFGSYFGSITGLLAFAGVLYTAWQSDKRAEKADERANKAEQRAEIAEEQVKTKDERDLFFKMLEVYQKQVDAIVYKNDKKGIETFECYAKDVNKYLIIYVALRAVIEHSFKNPNVDINAKALSSIIQPFYTKMPADHPYYCQTLYATLQKVLADNGLDLFENSYSDIYSYSCTIIHKMKMKEYFQAMEYVANLMYDKYGHFLGQYYRTIYYLLDLIKEYKENSTYSKLFRSQLSRYELLMLFYNVISSQSNSDVIPLYEKGDIFNNIVLEDILKCKIALDAERNNGSLYEYRLEEKKEKAQEFVNEILSEYRMQHPPNS